MEIWLPKGVKRIESIKRIEMIIRIISMDGIKRILTILPDTYSEKSDSNLVPKGPEIKENSRILNEITVKLVILNLKNYDKLRYFI